MTATGQTDAEVSFLNGDDPAKPRPVRHGDHQSILVD